MASFHGVLVRAWASSVTRASRFLCWEGSLQLRAAVCGGAVWQLVSMCACVLLW